MSAEFKKEIQLEIAHVLFIDIAGYSKLSMNEQRAVVDKLNQAVRASDEFRKAEAADRLIKIPTGDGMALVFYTSPEAPVLRSSSPASPDRTWSSACGRWRRRQRPMPKSGLTKCTSSTSS